MFSGFFLTFVSFKTVSFASNRQLVLDPKTQFRFGERMTPNYIFIPNLRFYGLNVLKKKNETFSTKP